MERRAFMGASIVTLCSTSTGFTAENKPDAPELYELRTYTLKSSKLVILEEYLQKAYIPTLKRLEIGPVGVFIETAEKDLVRVSVLVVHKTSESVASLPNRLALDKEYLSAADKYLTAKADDPVYQRIDSSLMTAIGGMPKLERPDASKPRLFNLRMYESHNERAAAKKIEMFEKSELAIFRHVGLTPVFFASTTIGAAMPNLTYMLVFPDDAGRNAAWDKFRTNPDWLKLKAIPEYADKEIVSKITNRLLTPASYSEI
jgi:hypothetical protein